MRRRLTLATAAVTSMVVIAFSVPLALVVQVIAQDRALDAGQLEARSLAVLAASVGDRATLGRALDDFGSESRRISVVFADDTALGAAFHAPDEVALARRGRGFIARIRNGGRAVYLPVRYGSGEITVIRVEIPRSELRRGVDRAWLAIAGLGMLMLLGALAAAARLARSMARPIAELERTARQLQSGDLDARAEIEGPSEVVAVGAALNDLASRIEDLLVSEREAAADLSHRLRTPLTALRLEVDGLPASQRRRRISDAVANLETAVDRVIVDTRAPRHGREAVSDLGSIVRDRLAFWGVLAEDQGRSVTVEVSDGPHPVAVPPDDLAASIDALLANVFAHTPDGVDVAVSVSTESPSGRAVLVVEDFGPGLPDGLPTRGSSARGTGLGLDIVRSTAERSGGGLELTSRRTEPRGTRAVVTYGTPVSASP